MMKHHDRKHLEEKKIYLAYTPTSSFTAEGSRRQKLKQSRNLEAADAETMEAAALLAGYPWLAQSAFLEPRNGLTKNELGLPTITN